MKYNTIKPHVFFCHLYESPKHYRLGVREYLQIGKQFDTRMKRIRKQKSTTQDKTEKNQRGLRTFTISHHKNITTQKKRLQDMVGK